MADNRRVPCFAIIRVDDFAAPEVALENRVSVTRVLLNEAVAEREVSRLNALNGHKGCRYFLQITRLVPEESG